MSIQSATSAASSTVAQLSTQGTAASRQGSSAAVSAGNTAEGGNARGPASVQEISAALQEIRNTIRPIASELSFSLEQDTGRMLVKIVDTETDEVIRQIPSEELLQISKALDKLQGLLLNNEA
jgi:flagellar protein FlaG